MIIPISFFTGFFCIALTRASSTDNEYRRGYLDGLLFESEMKFMKKDPDVAEVEMHTKNNTPKKYEHEK